MIAPTDLLAAALAASLRSRRVRRMSRREVTRAVRRAKAAWPRIRSILVADIRDVAA
jgi:hypothetical protein